MVYRIHAGEFRSTHDLSMNARFRKVVFLYRNPVDTLYSYCRYMNILPDEERIPSQISEVLSRDALETKE